MTKKIGANILEAAALYALFLLVYAAVLRFIFPGYLDPFWPAHPDLYVPVAMANWPEGLRPYFSYPRFVGQVFFWFVGHLGTRGAMAAVLMVVALNFTLIAMIARRVSNIDATWRFFAAAALFAYMLAAHPYQYQMSIWDAFAQLSLLLILIALVLRMAGAPLVACGVIVLLAFLAKETFILSAGLMAFAWFSVQRTRSALWPLVIVGVAAMLAIVIEKNLSSPFTNGDHPGGPYQLVMTLASVSSQWFQYIGEGINWLGLLAIIAAAIFAAIRFGVRSREFIWAVTLPIAGLLALLPNSLLPNHHFAGYSWNGAYLIYAPVIAFASIAGRGAIALALCAAVAGLCSPALSASVFAQQQYIIENQKTQRNLLRELTYSAKRLPRGERVLITGVDVRFSIFSNATAVRSLGAPEGTQFFVVATGVNPVPAPDVQNRAQGGLVQVIGPDDAKSKKFDQEWSFRADGSLVKQVNADAAPA